MTREEFATKLKAADANIAKATSEVSEKPAPSGTPAWWSVQDAMTVSSAVLLFGVFVIVLASRLIRQGSNVEAVLRLFGTILILVMAVFLVVAGYSNTQIAPVMGLLGTVAGYLLGKEVKATGPGDGVTPK